MIATTLEPKLAPSAVSLTAVDSQSPHHRPETSERPLITIEFAPKVYPNEIFVHPHPRYTYLEEITLKQDWQYCLKNNLNLSVELNFFSICAIELVEKRAGNGRLCEQPHWLYGIRNKNGKRLWFIEQELLSRREVFINQ